jgi:drug/metabolite transporter (DMT)-like permease
MNTRLVGYACLALAMISVGSTVIAGRLAGAGLPPFTATALRFVIAFPLFCLLMWARGQAWPRLGRRDLVLLMVQAASGSTGYTVLLMAGTRLTSAMDAGVMLGTLPAVSTMLAAALLRERPSRTDWAAAALATGGVLVVALGSGGAGFSARALAGDLLVLAAVGCESVFILLNKRLSAPQPPLVLCSFMTGFGLLVALLPALSLERGWSLAPETGPALMAVAYYALIPTVLGFFLWYAGTARTTGTEAALFTGFAPVSAVIFAAVLLGDPLTLSRLAGMVLVVAGVLLVAVPRLRQPG